MFRILPLINKKGGGRREKLEIILTTQTKGKKEQGDI